MRSSIPSAEEDGKARAKKRLTHEEQERVGEMSAQEPTGGVVVGKQSRQSPKGLKTRFRSACCMKIQTRYSDAVISVPCDLSRRKK
jgi:hypothetical protein